MLLLGSLWISNIPAIAAEENASIENESIYDLLVDRYFNQLAANDFHINTKDPAAFAGGDFVGVTEKLTHVKDMGFTILSVGSVFSTESYDGKAILSFDEIEKQFGTDEEFKALIDKTHDKDMKFMVEFPLSNYSDKHVWASDSEKKDWIQSSENGRIQLDLQNTAVQEALIDVFVDFAKKYEIDGVKLSELNGAPTEFINELISKLKEVRSPMYVITLEETEGNFDTTYSSKLMEVYRDTFKGLDFPAEGIENSSNNQLLMIDHINTPRFTMYSEQENMFPPTRIKNAMGAILTSPGVPYMTYGTEIAMNGEAREEAHQIMNFRVDEELIEYIQDINSIRNKSETMRTGDFELIKNENGYIVYKRSSEDETFIVVVNNTSKTQRIDISSELVGENKELRGIFESDLVRPSDGGSYRLVVDREIVEVFQVTDRKGLNTSYIIAMAVSYILFIVFLIIVWKKGKQRRKDEDKKANQNK